MSKYLTNFKSVFYQTVRHTASAAADACGSVAATGSSKRGLVIGSYDGCIDGCCTTPELTPIGTTFDSSTGGKIKNLLMGIPVRLGTVTTFTNVSPMYTEVAVVGVGRKEATYNELENLDEFKENVRVAAGVGARTLQDHGIEEIMVENFGDPEAAAEGATLGVWQYQENKHDDDKRNEAKVDLLEGNREQWDRGLVKAESQNIARCLCEIPANLLTPAKFAHRALDILCRYGIEVKIRDRRWLEANKMYAILASARGSCEPPYMLQLEYCGTNPAEKPVILIGKGTTFNCGGLCLKDCEGMSEFRADLSGAACVVATMRAVAAMRLPINIYGLIPLFENMISGMAMKPGDVLIGKNGKTIRDEHTDDNSRMALTDPMHYCKLFHPDLILNVATMSAGVRASLGGGPSAVFSTSDAIWEQLAFAGSMTGDRVWRLPLFKDYRHLITDYLNVDVNNVGKGIGGGACLGAAFLMEFALKDVDFAYIDNTGTGMLSHGFVPYLTGGLMTGRPTRTLIQFLCHRAYACNKKPLEERKPKDCRDV